MRTLLLILLGVSVYGVVDTLLSILSGDIQIPLANNLLLIYLLFIMGFGIRLNDES